MKRPLRFERIHQTHAHADKIRDVSGDQSEIVFQRGRSKKTVRGRRFLVRTQRSPSQCDSLGDFQHQPCAIWDQFFVQPLLDHSGLLKIILGPQSGDAIGNLAERNNTDVEALVVMSGQPPSYIGVSPLTTTHLRQDIGIQEKTHSNDTDRLGFTVRFLTGSKSKPKSPSDIKCLINPVLCPSASRQGAAAVIKSCFASSERERPFSAARASMAATTSSSRSSITSFVMVKNRCSNAQRQLPALMWRHQPC